MNICFMQGMLLFKSVTLKFDVIVSDLREFIKDSDKQREGVPRESLLTDVLRVSKLVISVQ